MRSRAGSSASTKSNKELSADNLPIYVNISDGKTIKLNVRPVHTVSNVLEFLSASTTLPTDVRLIHNGKHLDPSTTVAELKLQDSATLQLDPPTRRSATPPEEAASAMTAIIETKTSTAPTNSASSTPSTTAPSTPRTGTPSAARKSNKPRCSKSGCKAPAQPIVGDCGFCQKRFCGKHRMLESHACEGLEDARQADKDRNTAKLEGERTVMLRGLH